MLEKAKSFFVTSFTLALVLGFGYSQSYADTVTHVMEINNDSNQTMSFRASGPQADITFSYCSKGIKERGPCVVPPHKSTFLTFKFEQEKKDKEVLYFLMYNDVKSPYKVGEQILRVNYSTIRSYFYVTLGGIYDQVPALTVKGMNYVYQPIDVNTQVIITNR